MSNVMPLAQAHQAIIDAVTADASPFGLPAALVRERGTLKIYFYEPREEDRQPPHDPDEVYVVSSGSGTFATGDSESSLKRFHFGSGDAIFTQAGSIHRFENFSDDFATWVIMYGPEGGEQASN